MDSCTGLCELEYDEKKKKHVIVANWIKMLYNRGWLMGNMNDMIASAQVSDNNTCHIQGPKTVYALKFIMRKISTVRKVDDIDEFLDNNRQNYKFFVVTEMQSKAQKQLMEYENVEVFSDVELLVNIVDNYLVPVHIVLTDDEAQKYMDEYSLKKAEFPRILTTDPIAKYYNIKPGQLVKIIRPSITAGEEIALRICVPGQII